MPDPTSLPETEYFKTDRAAYQRLSRRAMGEVVRCLLATESPSGLTMEKVRNRARIFAACSTEPWARATGAVQHKPEGRHASFSALQTQYYRLLRLLRDRLVSTLLRKEGEIWEKARKRMVDQADYAIFRVTESAVHFHRLASDRRYGDHA